MAGKDEEPIDPLRAAIMASSLQASEAKKSAYDLLYEANLAREMEILAAERNQPPSDEWQPPSEDEFNQEWITPRHALKLIEPLAHGVFGQKWIITRLKSGLVIAIARDSERAGKRHSRLPIPTELWQTHTDYGDDHFWETGDASFWYNNKRTSCFDVRVRPENLFGEAPPAVTVLEPEQFTPALPSAEKPPLAKAEAERFCRAVIAGWPDLTQDWAYAKAVLFFPENKVNRDQFRSILRSIRPDVKRGRKPKIEQ